MTTRDLFNKKTPYKILSSKNLEKVSENVESSENISQRLEEKNRFIPVVNFEYPENFARYGKAEEYYRNSVTRIQDDYPYDGSLSEKTQFRNQSSYLDLYILDNKYPRTTGHAIFSPTGWGTVAASIPSFPAGYIALSDNPEYVYIKGGPNQAPEEFLTKSLKEQFGKANKYDPDLNRQSNLKMDFEEGITVEFWMDKPVLMNTSSYPSAGTTVEIPFMVSDQASGSFAVFMSTSDTSPTGTPFLILATSGSTFAAVSIPSIANSDYLADGWHHFAFSAKSKAGSLSISAYLDGELRGTYDAGPGTSMGEVTGNINAALGAGTILTQPSIALDIPSDGYGKISGSIDEFRYWKTERTPEDIGRYWFTQYGGGTNTDTSNTDLGVYYKFNEGIVGNNSTDSTVLDYSGRISNGTWVGYTSPARSTASAIDTYLGKNSEFRDPIIYSSHPEVISVTNSLISSGSDYDITNNSSIYNSIPSWITEDDEIGNRDLLKLTQIMSSYFDSLHMQIESMPRLKDKTYNDPTLIKPTTFSSRLLESQGFVAPEIFAEADVLAQILKRDADRKYELDLYDIKNTIYQNVYNNIVNIYKSKGTEKSFRNLIRCFGVDEELIRLNIYGNNVEYQIKDNYKQTSIKKNYVDFNHPDRFSATVYQQTASSDPNTTSYISGSSLGEYVPFTVECEVIFPKKLERSNPNYFETPFVTSSLFGFHGADNQTDFTWPILPSDDANLQVYAVKEQRESENIYFRLLNRDLSIDISTPIFEEVYNNQKWNLSLRVRPEQAHSDLVSGSANGNLVVEFSGINSDAGIVDEEFHYTTTVPSTVLTSNGKRLYAGCYRTNFTGSIIEQTDVKISSLRYWSSYLSDESLKTHARDPSNHGSSSPYQSSYLWPTSIDGTFVPQEETLALNWDFGNVVSSDSGISGIPTISDAGYYVADISSGSIDLTSRYGWLGNVLKYQHTGRGDFYIPNDSKVIDVKYIYGGKNVAPEIIQSSDMINILGESDLYFDRDSRPINFFYSIEKSMYQTISDEMLKMFSTIKDFSNLIGDPVNRYRQNYKSMEKLRQLFFENVENTPSLDKYIDFYKWIDSSLNIMIQQLIPMSADVSDEIRNMVESHVLERNKYQTKFPTLEFTPTDPNAGLQGINRLLYNWKYDHHPISNQQNENCKWWKTRADRTTTPEISSGDSLVDEGRQLILDARLTAINRSYNTPLRLKGDLQRAIKGGNNTKNVKGIDITRVNTKFGTTDGVRFTKAESPEDCTDVLDPNKKNYVSLWAKDIPNEEYLNSYGKNILPLEARFSDANLAYAGGGTSIVNVHRDVYGPDAEVPMQGPFTNQYVGGFPFRHVPINDGTDTALNRVEGWKYDIFSGFRFIYPDTDKPRGMYYRDETAKRPLNIKNIRGAYGNFTKNWEVVQSAGRMMNNKAWVSAEGWDLHPEGTPSTWVSGLNDVPKIQRGRNESVIVSRFSAPGGPDTMGDSNGGPGLDYLSAEYSFNNDMNARNWTVRSVNQLLLTSHVNQFGFFSNAGNLLDADSSEVNPLNYSGTGSVYQVNRNTLKRLELSGTVEITGSQYDNFWIQHAIPRSDLNYSWVNSSYVTVDPSALGYWTEGLFGYTAKVATVYREDFTSSFGPEWNVVNEVVPRKSKNSDNWVARFGDWTESGAGSNRILSLTTYFELPIQVSYEYARGQYENRQNKVFATFGENAAGAYTVLSGSGKYVDTWGTTATPPGNTNQFTISFWFKPANSTFTNQQYLFSWDDQTSNNAPARLYITPTEIGYYQQYTGGKNLYIRSLHSHSSSDWTHVALTHDVGAANAIGYLPTLYINGVSASLNVQSNTVTGSGELGKDFTSFIIGGRDPYNTASAANKYPNYCYTGSIDNIYWHAEILAPEQIEELYNDGFAPNVSELGFFVGHNDAPNYPNHYLDIGENISDRKNYVHDTASPPSAPDYTIYDFEGFSLANQLNLFAMQDSSIGLDGDLFTLEEYPGYNMTSPNASGGDTLKLQYQANGSSVWQDLKTLNDSNAFQGKDVGFITRTANLYPSATETSARIRFLQTSYNNAKRDNWAVNSVQVDRTFVIDPVTFSPYSDYVSYFNDPDYQFGKDRSALGSDPMFLPTTYNGLNYNIYEPITGLNNLTLGYDSSATLADYVNEDIFQALSLDFEAATLNALLLKRNGPYGYPIFKQVRTGEHAIARNLRRNNLIACTQEPGKRIDLNGQQYVERYGKTTVCREPAVNSSFGTLDYLLGFRVSTETKGKNPEYLVRPVQIKTTYGNNLGYFSSPILNVCADYDKTGLSSQPQAYDTIKGLYLDGALNDVNSPVYSLISLKYSERVFPAELNSYSGINRKRNDYKETFWRNSIFDRIVLGDEKFKRADGYGGRNSQGYTCEQSAWALDGNPNFNLQIIPTSSADINNYIGLCNPIATPGRWNASLASGELQNPYMFIFKRYESDPTGEPAGTTRTSTQLRDAALYSRKQGMQSYYSVVNPHGMEFINDNIDSSDYLNEFELSTTSTINPGGHALKDGDSIGYINGCVGSAKFETGDLAGTIVDGQFISKPENPFDDDYDQYNREMILKNKDYSIVPEFRISEHMEYYFNEKGRDFLTDNPAFLSINGTENSSSVDDFYTTFSYSDFMKYFEVIDSDHSKIDDLEKTLTIKCSALKKFIPYDGFYPAERTLEISKLFQESYAQYMSASITPLSGSKINDRPILSAFIAPGILYNTIKSGIAVDYPIYTSSYATVNYTAKNGVGQTFPTSYYALGTGSSGQNGWDYRVPFEAILNPEIVNGLSFIDMEVDPQSSIITAGGPPEKITTTLVAPLDDNLYKRSVSNFLAETTDFFLDKGLSTFVSDVDDGGYFFESGSYGMRIRIRRSMNKEREYTYYQGGSLSNIGFPVPQDCPGDENLYETITMYSRPTSFGPPVAGTDVFFMTASDSYTGRERWQNSDSLYGKNPSFTPPYYDGECWYDIVYSTNTAKTLTLDELFQEATTRQFRIQPSGKVWPNNDPLDPLLTGSFPMHRSNVNRFAMKLDSSILPFAKTFEESKKDPSQKSARWTIQTKFETPVLNFSDKSARPLTLENITLPTNVTGTTIGAFGSQMPCEAGTLNGYGGQTATPIGMWHQFGLIPQGDEGIHLSISDIDVAFLKRSNIDTSFYPNRDETKSLIDVVGFKPNDSRKIGSLAQSRTVSEAVVAIPYVIKNGKRRFFEIARGMIDFAEDTINEAQAFRSTGIPCGDSIIDMVRKMNKFVIPPRFDFVKHSEITPFATYIFEFNHTFNQDDLSYMWQNIAPPTGKRIEEVTAEISHKVIDIELMEKMKDKVRWIVFKVKQRGNNNYYSTLAGQSVEKEKQFDYSYNWPYDYFSLVEFVKIDSQVEYSTEKAIDVNESGADTSKELLKGIRATKPLNKSADVNRLDTAKLTRNEAKERKRRKKDRKDDKRSLGAFKTESGDKS